METSIPTINTHKTTLRIAVGVLFFMAGLSFASWASRIPTIQQKMGLSETALGAVLFSLPIGLMLSLPFSGWVITKFGSKKVILSAIVFYGLALISLGLAQNPFQLAICLVCFGFAGNTVNISVNTQAVAAENLHDKPIMASFHGLWSIAGFTGAGIGAFMVAHGVDPFHHFVIILGILATGVFFASKYLYDDQGAAKKEAAVAISVSEKIKNFAAMASPLIWLGVIAFCSLICEGAMFDWSGIYFKKVIAAPVSLQGVGFTAFMLTMALGRFMADRFAHRFGIRRTLQVSGGLTTFGLLVAVIFPYFSTAIIGFLLVGFGVSSVVPMIYSTAGKIKGMAPGIAITVVSTIGFIGFLVGPPLIGFIAGLATLRASFLFIAMMGMSVAVLSSFAKLESK